MSERETYKSAAFTQVGDGRAVDGVGDEEELEEGEIRGCGEIPDRVEAERGRQLKEVVDPRRPSVT